MVVQPAARNAQPHVVVVPAMSITEKIAVALIAICAAACGPMDPSDDWGSDSTDNQETATGDDTAGQTESGEASGEDETDGGPDVDMPAGDDLPDDGRAHIAEIDGAGNGRWDRTDEWSQVYSWADVDAMDHVNPSSLWPCNYDPDVDTCVTVDTVGHVGCFRLEYGFGVAVAVAPACAVDGIGWIDVGNDMVAMVNQI